MLDPKKFCCPGEGPLTAKIVMIGEAAGIHEARVGRPFYEKAKAGEKLRDVMHMVGLSRSEVYITNVLKEHPAQDDITPWFKIDRGRVYTSKEYWEYVELLKAELLEHKPHANVYVPLGNTALFALTGQIAITKRRGSILEGKFWSGMKVVPSIHPSSIAGEGSSRGEYIYIHYLRMDLKRAIAESSSPLIELPQRNLQICPTYVDSIKYLSECLLLDSVAFDIEVSSSEEISCISFAKSPHDAISINFAFGGVDVFNPDEEAEVWLAIERLLVNKRITKLGQNVIFDTAYIYRKYGIKTNNIDDTMVAMAITFPDFPKGLDFQTAMFTREPYYKDEGKKWAKIGDERAFFIYNAKDSAVDKEIFPKLMADCKRQGNEETYNRQKAIIPALTAMQEWGMKVNVEGMQNISKEAEIIIKQLTAELQDMCGYPINPNSPDQLMKYFYEKKGITPYLKDGRPTTDINALVRMSRNGVKEATLVKNIRTWTKRKSTYFDMVLSKDGRLRSAMNPVGTVTGRPSSSEDIFGEGGNILNLPEIVRQFIIADDGMVIYMIDLSQAENRIVANIAPEPLQKKAFDNGVDVHNQTYALIYGIPIEEVSDEDGSCELGTGEYSQRFWGKKANHSLNYDLGYKTFSLKYELPERQGKVFVERFHQVYPGIRQYHAWIRAALGKDRTITNLFGRKRLFLDRWGDEMFKESYAQIPQSTVADKMNEQGIAFVYYNQQWFHNVYLMNTIYDSLIFEMPISVGWVEHAEVLIRIVESLETPLSWHGSQFVIPADVVMGLSLHKKTGKGVEVHGKSAERLAGELSTVHEQFRGLTELSKVGGNLNNSSSSATEVQTTVGDG